MGNQCLILLGLESQRRRKVLHRRLRWVKGQSQAQQCHAQTFCQKTKDPAWLGWRGGHGLGASTQMRFGHEDALVPPGPAASGQDQCWHPTFHCRLSRLPIGHRVRVPGFSQQEITAEFHQRHPPAAWDPDSIKCLPQGVKLAAAGGLRIKINNYQPNQY